MNTFEIVVIGGGLVGAAIAYGLARAGRKVAVIDEGDVALRASRGNFGLVWVPGKGLGYPPYARWTRASADLWPEFAAELETLTGVDIDYRNAGGLRLCLDAAELWACEADMRRLRHETDGLFEYEMLDAAALREMLPAAAEALPGGCYCPHGGQVNPLYLLRALQAGIRHHGGHYSPDGPAGDIRRDGGGLIIKTLTGTVTAERVVLAAGHGSVPLAPRVGLQAPLRPIRGQVLITERLQRFLTMPTLNLRQTAEGTLQIGDSHEEVDFDDGTTGEAMTAIARRAVAAFPFLRSVRLTRAWGAIRIMTPDGFPIYQASESCPGAYLVTCHSGVTLAAAHARQLPAWITAENPTPEIDCFALARPHVPVAR